MKDGTFSSDATLTKEIKVAELNKTGASVTVTLMHASGSGDEYKFFVGAVNTSGYVINTPEDEDFVGSILQYSNGDGQTAPRLWSASVVSPSDQITLNGTTTGGQQVGDTIIFTDVAANTWHVRGWVHASGTEATPFTHNASSSPSSSPSTSISSSASSSVSSSISSSASSSVSSSPSSSVSSSTSSSVSSSASSSVSASGGSSISSSPSSSVSSSVSASGGSSISSSPSSSVSASGGSSISNSPSSSPSPSPS